jgi:hypothetical protein
MKMAEICRMELCATRSRNDDPREFKVTRVQIMAHPSSNWLLEPTFPAAAPLPRLDRELYELAEMDEPALSGVAPTAQYPSGTWLVGTRAELDAADADTERFATSDPEAPTVRPGSLHARKTG